MSWAQDKQAASRWLDAMDAGLGRVSIGAARQRRIMRWTSVLHASGNRYGKDTKGLHMPLDYRPQMRPADAAIATMEGGPVAINMQLRAVARVLWGAVLLSSPQSVLLCARKYSPADIRPYAKLIVRCLADEHCWQWCLDYAGHLLGIWLDHRGEHATTATIDWAAEHPARPILARKERAA